MSDNFVFDDSGNAYLQSGGSVIWSTNTSGKGVSAMELLDSGNLVLRGKDSSVIWQSFSHPTNTLLSNQEFTDGMRLVSNPNNNNLSYFLEIKNSDMILSAGFQTPQHYWSMSKENQKIINQDGGEVNSASLIANSWRSMGPTELLKVGDGLDYFALGYVSPVNKTDLDGCKAICVGNCSCLALFFENSSGNCFVFDSIGSFKNNGAGFVSFIKVLSTGGSGKNSPGGGGSSQKRFPYVIIIAISTVLIIIGLLYGAYRYHRRKSKLPESPKDNSEEDTFLESLSGMPIRFSYNFLQTATNNFSVKLGQGGFGSVYQGALPDGTRLAVKKLEGIGQGKKEFRAEVSIIGSIHHLHLVRLKGFCAEGAHRLLVYEYMANGSLDKWIFKKNREDFMLDWNTRFNIALGTAKGLAYLHEDCDAKIVHCDIKPENVLLDNNFLAKVSDFGLAKLMTREQSHVFTTLRGTRGYLAPEWITNYAISEKSDVYSYGIVLLEIIGGRKSYDPDESSEKSHYPSYAFKMMEEGKLRNILDSELEIDEEDQRVAIAIKVALWCIQDDMHLRPPMTKVVQMLEGLCAVSPPPMASQMGSRLYSNFLKSTSGEGTSSGPSDCNSNAHLSAVRLSGPR
ncbi:hypothetical protein HYC85_027345 [Camellia sinensis]|uniref:non-specific serine/threonine protein kinase n=1 Tax=Camellia sinensis TaxID=4442 RepID=A0A7J7GA83_CAMSI|nr:hypothetical protein HYC85_027345 [Camellia sinensis]